MKKGSSAALVRPKRAYCERNKEWNKLIERCAGDANAEDDAGVVVEVDLDAHHHGTNTCSGNSGDKESGTNGTICASTSSNDNADDCLKLPLTGPRLLQVAMKSPPARFGMVTQGLLALGQSAGIKRRVEIIHTPPEQFTSAINGSKQ